MIRQQPEKRLHSWDYSYLEEPKRSWCSVDVWIPTSVLSDHSIGRIADYLESEMGWEVARTVGWSGGASASDLSAVSVRVRVGTLREPIPPDRRRVIPPLPERRRFTIENGSAYEAPCEVEVGDIAVVWWGSIHPKLLISTVTGIGSNYTGPCEPPVAVLRGQRLA